MKVLIFEDEKLASDRLIELLQELNPSAEVVAAIKSVEAGQLWFENNDCPDLIISDIQLLDGTSFEIFEHAKTSCPVIFTTAYDEYAIQAFEVNSIDYLLKPIQSEKLKKALDKYDQRNTSTAVFDFEQLKALIQARSNPSYKSRFLVKVGQRIQAVPVEKIAYFYTRDKLTYLVSFEGKKLPLDHTLEEIDEMLNPKDFFRANRKFIVHFDSVSDIHPYFKGRVKLGLNPPIDDEIVISTEKTPSFKKWLDN